MSDDQIVIQPDDDDLSKPPSDLNDYRAWLRRGDLGLAMEGLLNHVTMIVGNEQTARILVKQLREEQAARDEELGKRLEFFAHNLKTSLNKSIGAFEEQTIARLDAYGVQIDALPALVEAALSGPFGEIGRRVDTLEYGYAQLAEQVELALDPVRHPQVERLEAIQNKDRQQAHEEMLDLDRALGRQLRVWALIIIVATVVVTSLISVVIHRVLYEAIR